MKILIHNIKRRKALQTQNSDSNYDATCNKSNRNFNANTDNKTQYAQKFTYTNNLLYKRNQKYLKKKTHTFTELLSSNLKPH